MEKIYSLVVDRKCASLFAIVPDGCNKNVVRTYQFQYFQLTVTLGTGMNFEESIEL
jgi:hypothetical protein